MAAGVLKMEVEVESKEEEVEKEEEEALAAVQTVAGETEHLEDLLQWHRTLLAQIRRAGFDHRRECSLTCP